MRGVGPALYEEQEPAVTHLQHVVGEVLVAVGDDVEHRSIQTRRATAGVRDHLGLEHPRWSDRVLEDPVSNCAETALAAHVSVEHGSGEALAGEQRGEHGEVALVQGERLPHDLGVGQGVLQQRTGRHGRVRRELPLA